MKIILQIFKTQFINSGNFLGSDDHISLDLLSEFFRVTKYISVSYFGHVYLLHATPLALKSTLPMNS